jgi:hypothetical protein
VALKRLVQVGQERRHVVRCSHASVAYQCQSSLKTNGHAWDLTDQVPEAGGVLVVLQGLTPTPQAWSWRQSLVNDHISRLQQYWRTDHQIRCATVLFVPYDNVTLIKTTTSHVACAGRVLTK